MSIFTNNVTPEAPSSANRNWNNVGYQIWLDILNNDIRGRVEYWFSYASDEEIASNSANIAQWQTKSQLKNRYKNVTKLSDKFKKELDTVIDKAYEKYGVWLKYKVQFGPNKRIKSIYFIRFC